MFATQAGTCHTSLLTLKFKALSHVKYSWTLQRLEWRQQNAVYDVFILDDETDACCKQHCNTSVSFYIVLFPDAKIQRRKKASELLS